MESEFFEQGRVLGLKVGVEAVKLRLALLSLLESLQMLAVLVEEAALDVEAVGAVFLRVAPLGVPQAIDLKAAADLLLLAVR